MGDLPMIARINGILAERGIMKKDFYKACKITSSAYSQWNNKVTSPTKKNLEAISKFLNVSIDYLIDGAGEKEKLVPISGDELYEKGNEMYCKLNEENRALVDQMIEKLLKSQSDQ